MYGDRFGSPGRDDRQDDSDPQGGWDGHSRQSQPSSDDVKVAGTPITDGHGRPEAADATTAMPGAGEGARYDGFEGPRDDIDPHGTDFESMRRTPRSKNMMKIGVIAAAVVVVGGGTVGAFALTGGSDSPKTTPQAAQVQQSEAPPPAPLTDAQRKDAADKRRTELKKRASRAARQDHNRPTLFAKGEPVPTKKPSSDPTSGSGGGPVPAGEAQRIAKAMLPDYGWSPGSQFGCLVNLWNRESGWNVHASNSSSGAYGIPQALPGSKMASAGSDWRDSARTQIKWGLGYIKGRYSTPCGAWAHSQSTGWY